MKKLLLLLAMMTFGSVLFAQAPDIDNILATLDGMSNFEGLDFSAQMNMITEDPEEGIDRISVLTFRRDAEEKNLLLIQSPDSQAGQGYLMIEDNLWFYDPESRQFTHTSMTDNFEDSDAKNSDFGSSSYADDYQVVSYEETSLGSYNVWKLEMEAIHNEVTYPYQTIWVTKDNYLILKSEDYSLTKRLLRTSYFPTWAQVGDSFTPSKMIFVDALVTGKKTQITLSNISISEIPDTVFTKAYLERVSR